MKFTTNKLPSSSKDIEWYWNKYVNKYGNFSKISVQDSKIDFTKPVDYFALSANLADYLSVIGRSHTFFELPIRLREFELRIFNDLGADTQIGSLLSNITHLRNTAEAYGIYATFMYIEKAVYCAFTICYVDKDFGQEMETAVVEISQDESAYIQPLYINEEALDYYSFDDIAKIAYWLGNFWLGIQYEMNNPPEEFRIVEQRGPIAGGNDTYKTENKIVLVKRVIPLDKDGNVIEYGPANSGRKYKCPAWGVQGHYRHYKSGKVIYIESYIKGDHRDNPDALIPKEYRFEENKIIIDMVQGLKE